MTETTESLDQPPLFRWLAAWVAPPTLISLAFFGSLVAVAHYRLGQVEVQVAEIRATLQQEHEQTALIYQRRDVLLEQLRQIQTQLDEIKTELRERRRIDGALR